MNRLRVLDTNRLINHWCRSCKGSLTRYSRDDAAKWARRLISLEGTSAVFTPVVIEFLCGARDGHELELYRAYLEQFEVVDRGVVTQADLLDAQRRASWVRGDGMPRDFGDCLIAAIASRLGYEIRTNDIQLSEA
ncbi:MAG: PIN domain-containing protein [Isosphaeraceae bacterium]